MPKPHCHVSLLIPWQVMIHDILKLKRWGADKRARTKTDMSLERGGKSENSLPHPCLSLCKLILLLISFLTPPPLPLTLSAFIPLWKALIEEWFAWLPFPYLALILQWGWMANGLSYLSSHLHWPSYYGSFNLLMKQVTLSVSLSIALKTSLRMDPWFSQFRWYLTAENKPLDVNRSSVPSY